MAQWHGELLEKEFFQMRTQYMHFRIVSCDSFDATRSRPRACIAGVRAGRYFRKTLKYFGKIQNLKIRISLRSRGPYDVSLVAGEFNGGGHKNASGCTIRTTIKDAEHAVVDAAIRCLESL